MQKRPKYDQPVVYQVLLGYENQAAYIVMLKCNCSVAFGVLLQLIVHIVCCFTGICDLCKGELTRHVMLCEVYC